MPVVAAMAHVFAAVILALRVTAPVGHGILGRIAVQPEAWADVMLTAMVVLFHHHSTSLVNSRV